MERELTDGPSAQQLIELQQHLEHCSAEINSACREGLYCHLGVPTITHRLKSLTVDLNTQAVIDYDIEIDVRMNYSFAALKPERIKLVDARDELAKRRSPEYQPPPGMV